MEGGHHAVSRLHRLKGDGPFLASDLSNDDPIRALPQGRFEEIEHADLAAFLIFSRPSGHLSNPVLVGNLQFRRILYAHDLFVGENKGGDGVHRGRLARRRRAHDEQVHALLKDKGEIRGHHIVHGSPLDEIHYTRGGAGELTDCEVAPPPGDVGPINDVYTRTIGERSVNNRVADRDGLFDPLAQPDHEFVQFLFGGEDNGGLETLKDLVFDKDRPCSTATYVLDVGVQEQRGQESEADLVSHEEILERLQFLGRHVNLPSSAVGGGDVV